MGNMGTIPATGYESSVVQTFSSPTGTSHTMTYTASVNDMILVINNVIQEPTVAYTTSGTTLTTGTLISGDTMYIVYLALTRQTVAPGADTVTNAMIVDNAINSEHYTDGSIDLAHMSVNSIDSDQYVDASIDNAHLADDAVGVDELSATGTASSSTFLRGDNAWAAAASVATGFIGGLTISNNGSDAAHDIDIAVGSARDYTDAVTMTQGTAALTKRIDATWVVGDGNGGLDSTDTVGANTGYGVYLIRRSDTGVVDVLISSDMTAAGSALTMPTNYDQKRLIGWVRTNAASNIFTFIQSGNYFRIMTAGTIYELYDSSITNNTYDTVWLLMVQLPITICQCT